MQSIKEIFTSLGENQVLVLSVGEDEAVMDNKDSVTEVFGDEFAIIRCGEDRLPIPVSVIDSVRVMDRYNFIAQTILKMADDDTIA